MTTSETQNQFQYSNINYLFVQFKAIYTIFLTQKDLNKSHYLLHYHHFNHQPRDLMSSVKCVCHNFEPMPENNKKDVLLYGASCFDENKNKFILEIL